MLNFPPLKKTTHTHTTNPVTVMHFLKCTVHTYYETQYIIPAATFPSTVVGEHPS